MSNFLLLAENQSSHYFSLAYSAGAVCIRLMDTSIVYISTPMYSHIERVMNVRRPSLPPPLQYAVQNNTVWSSSRQSGYTLTTTIYLPTTRHALLAIQHTYTHSNSCATFLQNRGSTDSPPLLSDFSDKSLARRPWLPRKAFSRGNDDR